MQFCLCLQVGRIQPPPKDHFRPLYWFPLDLDTLIGDSDHLLSHLGTAIQSDLVQTSSDINSLPDGIAMTSSDHDQPLDLLGFVS